MRCSARATRDIRAPGEDWKLARQRVSASRTGGIKHMADHTGARELWELRESGIKEARELPLGKFAEDPEFLGRPIIPRSDGDPRAEKAREDMDGTGIPDDRCKERTRGSSVPPCQERAGIRGRAPVSPPTGEPSGPITGRGNS